MQTKLDVATFMRAGGQAVSTKNPGYYDERISQADLYYKLVKEEFDELTEAVQNRDIIETADACADLIWVVEGLMRSEEPRLNSSHT